MNSDLTILVLRIVLSAFLFLLVLCGLFVAVAPNRLVHRASLPSAGRVANAIVERLLRLQLITVSDDDGSSSKLAGEKRSG